MSLLGALITWLQIIAWLIISLGLLTALIIMIWKVVSRILSALNSYWIFWICFIISLLAEVISLYVTRDYENASIPYIIAMILMVLAGICYLSPLNIPRVGKYFSPFRGLIRALLSPENTEYENDPEKSKVIIGWSSKIFRALGLIQALGALGLIQEVVDEDYTLKLVIAINLIGALLLSLLHDLYSYKLEQEKDRSEPEKLTVDDDKRSQSMPRLCRRRGRRTRRSYNRF